MHYRLIRIASTIRALSLFVMEQRLSDVGCCRLYPELRYLRDASYGSYRKGHDKRDNYTHA